MTKQTPRHQRSRRRQQRSKAPLIMGGAFVAIIALIIVLVVLTKDTKTADKDQVASVSQAANSITMYKGEAGRTEDGFWYKGSPDAPVKVVEYADYECPACTTLEHSLQTAGFDATYIETGKVQYIYKELPLPDAGHIWAYESAETARCAGDQGLFWPVHDMLFATQPLWTQNQTGGEQIIREAAIQAGVNSSELDACMAADTNLTAIQDSRVNALDSGVNSTPTLEVNGERISLTTVDGLIQAIEAKLPAAGQQ